MIYFSSKPEEKIQSPSMQRDVPPFIAKCKMTSICKHSKLRAWSKMPVFSENFKIQHPFLVQRSQIHWFSNA